MKEKIKETENYRRREKMDSTTGNERGNFKTKTVKN